MKTSMFLVFCVFALLVCDVNADSFLEIREIKYSDMRTPEFKNKKLVLLLYDGVGVKISFDSRLPFILIGFNIIY